MNVALEPSEQKSIAKFVTDWVNVNKPPANSGSFTSDIQITNPDIKPTFPRSAKMRKKKKIMINKRIATLRNPRTVVYKNCHPVAVNEVGPSSNEMVVMEVTFQMTT